MYSTTINSYKLNFFKNYKSKISNFDNNIKFYFEKIRGNFFFINVPESNFYLINNFPNIEIKNKLESNKLYTSMIKFIAFIENLKRQKFLIKSYNKLFLASSSSKKYFFFFLEKKDLIYKLNINIPIKIILKNFNFEYYLKKIKLQQLSNTINTDFKLQFNKKVFLNSLKKFKFSYYVKTIFLNKNYKKKIWLEKFSYIKKKYTKPYSLLYKNKYLIKKIKKFNFKSYYKNFIIFANFSKKSKNNLINLINKSFFVQY